MGPDASRFALTRFGREVDVDNTILFEQFRDDKATLIEAVDAMVYNGSGRFCNEKKLIFFSAVVRSGQMEEIDCLILRSESADLN